MSAGPTPACETICEKAMTTPAAPIRPKSAGVINRPRAINTSMYTTTRIPVPENVQNIPLKTRFVSRRGCGRSGDVGSPSVVIEILRDPARALNVQIAHVLGVSLDKLPSRLDLVAHQLVEQLRRLHRVLHRDAKDGPSRRIHRGAPELCRIHFSESLVALDVDRALAVAILKPLRVLLSLRLAIGVELFLPFRNAIERRLGDVHVACLYQRLHLPEEEGEEQRADVGAVHVGIRHQNDLVVPHILEVEVVLHPGSYRRDHFPDLLVAEDAVDAGALDVEDLAPQRENRLKGAAPSLLGAAAGGVTLDQIDLGVGRIVDGAVGELAR